ncbi:hypothetical protein N9W89_01030 [Hellea sp.]|nr:hypothetical protein [Hellea sp.]
MRSTTITGEVKNLQRVQVAGENSAMFEIGNQSVRLYASDAILDNGDQVVVAGKHRGDVFVSSAIHNLSQSETAGQKWGTKLIPYIFSILFLGLGTYVTLHHMHHGHGAFFTIIYGAFFFAGFGCLYFPLSQFRRKRLVKKTAHKID